MKSTVSVLAAAAAAQFVLCIAMLSGGHAVIAAVFAVTAVLCAAGAVAARNRVGGG